MTELRIAARSAADSSDGVLRRGDVRLVAVRRSIGDELAREFGSAKVGSQELLRRGRERDE